MIRLMPATIARRVLALLALGACAGSAGRAGRGGGGGGGGALDSARLGAPDSLALATFDAAWSLVHRRHWDTTYNGVDWLALRDELRPRAAAAGTREELRDVIRDMLGRLRQSHFALIPREAAGGLTVPRDSARREPSVADDADAPPGDAGMELRLIDGHFIVAAVDSGGAAARAGIRTGWEVRAIDEIDLAGLFARMPAELRERNARLRATLVANALLAGDAGRAVAVRAYDARDAEVMRILRRTPMLGAPIAFGNLPVIHARFDHGRETFDGASIGYIAFSSWMPALMRPLDEAVDALRDTDGIIIDLRGNLGGVAGLVMGTAGHFLEERLSLGTMKTRQSDLRFVANPRRATADGRRVVPYAGPVAILTDELSASTSELFAGGMQALRRARIFGDTTAGQALPALMERLPNGDVLYHATADLLTPDGRRLEGQGVSPDALIRVTRADLLRGADPVRQAAVRWIAEERAKRQSVPR